MRRLLIIFVMIIVSALSLLLLAGHGPWAGRPLWSFGQGHGINTGDLSVLALWATGMVCCAVLIRRP